MESLFGRFPHLVEDIFGLLNGKTLSSCSQINKIWKVKLEEYRLHLIKKIQKCLKNQNVIYRPVEDSDKGEDQNSNEITFNTSSNFSGFARIMEDPMTVKWNITVEQLPLAFLVSLLKYFCDDKPKDREVNLGIISMKNTSGLFGIFIKNEPNEKKVISKKTLTHLEKIIRMTWSLECFNTGRSRYIPINNICYGYLVSELVVWIP